MSEYQYYEFQAVDRPLTQEQIIELRGYSSRADRAVARKCRMEFHHRRSQFAGAASGCARQARLGRRITVGRASLERYRPAHRYLKDRQVKTELGRIDRELRSLKRQIAALGERRAKLLGGPAKAQPPKNATRSSRRPAKRPSCPASGKRSSRSTKPRRRS